MEAVQEPSEVEHQPSKLRLFVGQLSWRMILMRLIVNGLTLIIVALLVPNIYFVDRSFLTIFLMAVALGILNAFVKPIVQFLTLPFIFATYGFVIVIINTTILILMAFIFEERFYVSGLLWATVGGLVMGIVSSLLESLLGLNLPIIDSAGQSQEAWSSPRTGTAITEALVDEMSGRSKVKPAQSEDAMDSKQAEEESTVAGVVDLGGDASPIEDFVQPDEDNIQEQVETDNNDEKERPGDGE